MVLTLNRGEKMDFLIDNVFKNLYITVPSVILWGSLYIYFTVSVYLEYVTRVERMESYRQAINHQIADMMFWVNNKDNISDWFLDNARIVYYIIHSLGWPISWFYHKFIARDIAEGVERRREDLSRLNNSETAFDNEGEKKGEDNIRTSNLSEDGVGEETCEDSDANQRRSA